MLLPTLPIVLFRRQVGLWIGASFVVALVAGCEPTPQQKTVQLRELLTKNEGDEAARLINSGANILDTDVQGVTLLHLAASRGLQKAAGALVAKGADVNAKTAEGVTPLYEAVSNGHVEIVELLLRCEADPNIAPPGKSTALAIARQRNLPKITQLLQSKQAR